MAESTTGMTDYEKLLKSLEVWKRLHQESNAPNATRNPNRTRITSQVGISEEEYRHFEKRFREYNSNVEYASGKTPEDSPYAFMENAKKKFGNPEKPLTSAPIASRGVVDFGTPEFMTNTPRATSDQKPDISGMVFGIDGNKTVVTPQKVTENQAGQLYTDTLRSADRGFSPMGSPSTDIGHGAKRLNAAWGQGLVPVIGPNGATFEQDSPFQGQTPVSQYVPKAPQINDKEIMDTVGRAQAKEYEKALAVAEKANAELARMRAIPKTTPSGPQSSRAERRYNAKMDRKLADDLKRDEAADARSASRQEAESKARREDYIRGKTDEVMASVARVSSQNPALQAEAAKVKAAQDAIEKNDLPVARASVEEFWNQYLSQNGNKKNIMAPDVVQAVIKAMSPEEISQFNNLLIKSIENPQEGFDMNSFFMHLEMSHMQRVIRDK